MMLSRTFIGLIIIWALPLCIVPINPMWQMVRFMFEEIRLLPTFYYIGKLEGRLREEL